MKMYLTSTSPISQELSCLQPQMRGFLLLSALLGCVTIDAFFIQPATSKSRMMMMMRQADSPKNLFKMEEGAMDRRDALQSMGQLLGLSVVLLSQIPRKVNAAVGEGGLPETAEAFQRIIKGQKEWGKVGETIKKREGNLADDEWKNTQIFLRNTYMVGEDMRRLVRDSDGDERTKVIDIAKAFQRLTLDMDKPTKNKDWKGFLEQHAQGVEYYKQFLDALSDVPDEL